MNGDYELEIDQIKEKIEKTKAKTVLIQLPDGLKPLATEISKELEKTGSKIYIWGGTCFGACDIPKVDFDLLIQFGHNEFRQVE